VSQPRPAAQPKADAPDPVADWTTNPDNYFLEAAKNPVAANLALVDHHFQQHVAPVLGDLLETMADMQLEIAVSRFAGAKTKNDKGEATPVNEGFHEFLESGGMEKTLQENPMLLQQLIQARHPAMETFPRDSEERVRNLSWSENSRAGQESDGRSRSRSNRKPQEKQPGSNG
jgi:hypothetical protein